VIHRDIKPGNLFVLSSNQPHDFVKVLDFGLAKVQQPRQRRGATQLDSVAGTPAFLSPEVAQGRPADARSDIYSLGATLDFLLTGQTPVDRCTAAQLLQAQIHNGTQRPCGQREQALSEALASIVLRCLEQDPKLRYQTAAQLVEALAAVRVDAGGANLDSVPDPER
jgi:serine/threonine-protein kinase